ncbi:MAG: hypothetical protein AAB490_00495 [Patescibacteria group bacterium]
MRTEQDILKFLEEECYTDPATKDPCKPLILEGGVLKPNPDFDPALLAHENREREIERRKKHLGTSFFLNFDPFCEVHQIAGDQGHRIRVDIGQLLLERFIRVFFEQFPIDDPPPLRSLEDRVEVRMCQKPRPGFDNGEVYIWLRGLPLKEEFVFAMLKQLRDSLRQHPILVTIDDKNHEVTFYGWGFRYI